MNPVQILHKFRNPVLLKARSEILESLPAILVLLVVGMLVGVWIAAGVVPLLIHYGLMVLAPGWFLVASCIICAVVALATGSSWSTAATVGLALVGVGQALGIHAGMTAGATGSGFSRGVEREPVIIDDSDEFDARRFAVVYHLLSLQHNLRMRLRTHTGTSNPPVLASVVDIWNSANWFEREAFDLYGIVFDGHPDLRRILTDYGFIGHPFRKDFPLSGNVEVAYDADKGRVAYQPVSIEPRVGVPRVIRDDNRYSAELKDGADG